jgi:NAD(P)-dependent dehydrogenase (short-subunit alcohol dehydrogenase family)
MPDSPQRRQVALVTGGGSGIGRAVALELAAAGYLTVVVGRGRAALEQTVAMAAAGRCSALAADLAATAGVERVTRYMYGRHSELEVLVNNAGIAQLGPLRTFSPQSVDAHLAVNLGGMLKLTAALVPLLAAARPGHVINVSSEQSLHPAPGRVVYGATKAALNYVTRALAAELAPQEIRVNALLPGAVDTAMLRSATGGSPVTTPLGNLVPPADIARWVSHLLQSRNVTGALITVDAGVSLQDIAPPCWQNDPASSAGAREDRRLI